MSYWYNKVTADLSDLSPIVDAISHFEMELVLAVEEVKIKGSLEKASARLPGLMTYRFGQLQEVEAILRYLQIRMEEAHTNSYKKYLEGYAKTLSSRDADKYASADSRVVELSLLINRFALCRNQYLAVTKGLESKNFQINNLVKLKTAGMEDYQPD